LSARQKGSIWGWLKFYNEHAEYFYVGKVVGRYFDEQGNPTEEFLEEQKVPEEVAKEEAEVKAWEDLYPPCNSRWSQKDGSSVWCTNDMNEASVRLVPRYTFVPGQTHKRCSCVEFEEASQDPNKFKPIEGCIAKSQRCQTKPAEPKKEVSENSG
jgi:hypothetical protein